MWHIVYLGFINVLVGVTTSVVIRRRAQWVRARMDEGYDFDRIQPTTWVDRLPFCKTENVDLEQLCQTIDPDFEPRPWMAASSLSPKSSEIPSTDVPLSAASIDPAASETLIAESVFPDHPAETTLSELVAAPTPVAATELPAAAMSSMEVIDLCPKTDGDENEDLVASQIVAPARDDLETGLPGSLAPGLTRDGFEDEVAKRPEVFGESSPTHRDVEEPDTDDSIHDSIPEPGKDFLEQVSGIERLLHLAIDDPAGSEVSLEASSAQVIEAADYWETFRDTTRQLLRAQPAEGEVVHNLEELVEAVNSQIHVCRNIACQALEETDDQPQSVARQLRDNLLSAASGSHQLRDRMAMSVSNERVRFGLCSPQELPHYHEGLSGLRAVLDEWEQLKTDQDVASLGILDVDQFEHLNRQFGLLTSDRLLAICCERISRSIRHNRGFDRLIRVGGQQFLIFFGYTKGPDSCFALERLRQLFQATVFDIQGESARVTLRGVAIDHDPEQSDLEALTVLRNGLKVGAENGGNQTLFSDRPDNFHTPGSLPDYECAHQVIPVAEMATVD